MDISFRITGDIFPLADLVKATRPDGRRGVSRPLGGWLTTYGKIGPDGGIVPTVDRDDQVFEAARELGHIDWSGYLPPHGLWNDTHKDGVIRSPAVIVGVPETLEFHDGTTRLSQAHGKVGFWTTGHLWDPADPASWEEYTSYRPSPADLARADEFWLLASQILHGTPRKLAFSAHGKMRMDPTRRRIVWAQITQAAVCEIPRNPDSTADVLPGPYVDDPAVALAKAVATADMDEVSPESLEGLVDLKGEKKFEELVKKLQDRYLCDRKAVMAFLRDTIARRKARKEQDSA
jgi:hypothetical protein